MAGRKPRGKKKRPQHRSTRTATPSPQMAPISWRLWPRSFKTLQPKPKGTVRNATRSFGGRGGPEKVGRLPVGAVVLDCQGAGVFDSGGEPIPAGGVPGLSQGIQPTGFYAGKGPGLQSFFPFSPFFRKPAHSPDVEKPKKTRQPATERRKLERAPLLQGGRPPLECAASRAPRRRDQP